MPKSKQQFTQLRLVLKGEVVEKLEVHYLQDGRIIETDKIRKIVVPSKKNQQQITINKATMTPVLIPSAAHASWHKSHEKIFEAWKQRIISIQGVPLPIARCKLKILFYFPDNRRRDLTNKAETITDMLVDCDIIEDDKFQVLKPVVIDGWVQRDNPRTEIYITVMSPEMADYKTDITSPSYQETQRTRKSELQRNRRAIRRDASKPS